MAKSKRTKSTQLPLPADAFPPVPAPYELIPRDPVPPAPVCIIPNCGNPAQWKGLCSHCYGTANELIKKNETSWAKLYDLGLALDDRPFILAYRAKLSST